MLIQNIEIKASSWVIGRWSRTARGFGRRPCDAFAYYRLFQRLRGLWTSWHSVGPRSSYPRFLFSRFPRCSESSPFAFPIRGGGCLPPAIGRVPTLWGRRVSSYRSIQSTSSTFPYMIMLEDQGALAALEDQLSPLELLIELLDLAACEGQLGVIEAKGFSWLRPVLLGLWLGYDVVTPLLGSSKAQSIMILRTLWWKQACQKCSCAFLRGACAKMDQTELSKTDLM